MRKVCSICGREAAYAVIDKLGFMEPGVLCPSDFITWKRRPAAELFIFHELEDGADVMRRYLQGRNLAEAIAQGLDEDRDLELFRMDREIKTLDEIKFNAIIEAYEANDQNARKACKELKISKATFYRELRRHGYVIDKRARRKEEGNEEGPVHPGGANASPGPGDTSDK